MLESNNNNILVCRASITNLQYSLLWPSDGTELNPGLEYKIKVLVFLLINGFMFILLIVNEIFAIKNYGQWDTEEITVLAAACVNFYMVFSYLKKQHQLALLVKDLSNFSKYGKPSNFERRCKQLDFWVAVISLYSLVGVCIYVYIKVYDKAECIRIRKKKGINTNNCGLAAPMWIPFEIDYFPIYQLCLIYGFLYGFLLVTMSLRLSALAFSIAHHIILRIKHLKVMIFEFSDEKNEKIQTEMLRKCISYHIEILDFAARLDDAFFYSMFGNFTPTGAICALLEKQIVDGVNRIGSTAHIAGWLIALFAACLVGQDFLDASVILPEALYSCKWYQADIKLQRNVLLMLLRSQKDLVIRAGPFGVLSYPLFLAVIKMSYSILCVLMS